jgi:hypothetical protein
VIQPELTTDYQIWHSQDSIPKAMQQWISDQSGFLATWPFGCFAYARLDERLKESPLWENAPRLEGKDPMGQSENQPTVEFFNTECYAAPVWHYKDFPVAGNSAFAMVTQLFAPRSKGTGELKSANPADNPIVNHHFLEDPLDILVLAEGCKLGNEIILEGSGTRDIIKGSWPPNLVHHKYSKNEEWEKFVRENATTCKSPILSYQSTYAIKVIIQRVLAQWERVMIVWQSLIMNFEYEAYKI